MPTHPKTFESFRQALALLKSGRAGDARSLLAPIAQAHPHLAEAHRLLAFAHLATGDRGRAEQAFGRAAAADPRDPSLPACLGELALDAGHLSRAEAAWRASLAIDPGHIPAAIGLARLLVTARRSADALAITEPLAWQAGCDSRLLDVHARILAALARHDEALVVRRTIAERNPPGFAAEQNLAAAFLDLGRHSEAVAAAERATARGGDAPELHYLRGRALQGLDRFDEADDAYRAVLGRNAGYAEAARDLAHLIWMRTGELDRARLPLDAAARAAPGDPAPILFRARLREFAGDPAGAYDELTALADRHPDHPEVHIAAGQAAIAVEPELAMAHLDRARRLSPPAGRHDTVLAAACIATGDPARAVALLEPLCHAAPHDQSLIAFMGTAWRLLGDPRYAALFDYTALVGRWTLDTPGGWPSLPAYIADLAGELHALHRLKCHPVGQSLRQGTMAERNLLDCDTPAIRAFQDAIDGPIRRHLAWLRHGDDVLRSRATGGYRMAGIWTVRLSPGGFHVDHVHPKGWLSSACHIEVPCGGEGEREGWLKFGEPGIPSRPALPAEYFVRPLPGQLVLFPSYMWHGTVPFTVSAPRLTIAFDLLPAAAPSA